MIAFSRLGKYGRFGNQLFQYAFLRATAQRLGVKFYCPEWAGDSLFSLNDENERAKEAVNIDKFYFEPKNNGEFNKGALAIQDNTDILGFFQTEKYFDKNEVKKWYTFRPEVVSAVRDRYKHIDFSKSTGMHLRFGDNKNKVIYVIAPSRYYKYGLEKVRHKENILIFSDEIGLAKKHLRKLKSKLIFVEGNDDYEDFYLMTLCHDFICSVSTFSWWPAWLNNYEDKIIVCPKEWTRPGCRVRSNDLYCDGWVSIKTCRYLLDEYHISLLRYYLGKIL